MKNANTALASAQFYTTATLASHTTLAFLGLDHYWHAMLAAAPRSSLSGAHLTRGWHVSTLCRPKMVHKVLEMWLHLTAFFAH